MPLVRLKTSLVCSSILFFSFVTVQTCLAQPVSQNTQAAEIVRIGVVQLEDPYFYLDSFGPTMAFLRQKHPDIVFESEEIPMDIPTAELSRKNFDFLISPSGFYAAHSFSAGLRQIVTRKPDSSRDPSYSVGSLFVVRNNFEGESLASLKGKRAVAYESNSLAGWLSAIAEIIKEGFDHNQFFSSVVFTNYGTPSPINYLLSGRADVAILPTCEYERFLLSRNTVPDDFKVIGSKESSLSCQTSTALYPDVVFSSFPSAKPELVRLITVSLLTNPSGMIKASWSIANDFLAVNRLFQTLNIGPYAKQEISLLSLYERFKREIFLAILLLAGMLFHILRVNQLVLKRTSELRMAIAQRDAVAQVARSRLKRLNYIEKKGMVSQLSSIIAHELKQPLSSVSNYSAGLIKYLSNTGSNDDNLREGLSEIHRGIKKAASIVDKVRSYSKYGAYGTVGIVSLSEITEKALSSIEAYVAGNSPITCKLEESTFIEADPLELELLVFNVLKNALEAIEPMGKEGRIFCKVFSSQHRVVLQVDDNGPKIKKEKLESMRKALQESIKAEGLGLGLTIILGIGEKYDGAVEFEQREPQGIRVTVSFQKRE